MRKTGDIQKDEIQFKLNLLLVFLTIEGILFSFLYNFEVNSISFRAIFIFFMSFMAVILGLILSIFLNLFYLNVITWKTKESKSFIFKIIEFVNNFIINVDSFLYLIPLVTIIWVIILSIDNNWVSLGIIFLSFLLTIYLDKKTKNLTSIKSIILSILKLIFSNIFYVILAFILLNSIFKFFTSYEVNFYKDYYSNESVMLEIVSDSIFPLNIVNITYKNSLINFYPLKDKTFFYKICVPKELINYSEPLHYITITYLPYEVANLFFDKKYEQTKIVFPTLVD